MERKTILSADRIYRFALWREWDLSHCLPYDRVSVNGFEPLPLKTAGEFCLFIGLNPSTADERQDDPTIRRCVGFAKKWGYGALCMANLFAFRSTDPQLIQLRPAAAGGYANDNFLRDLACEASLIICGWGTNGKWKGRDAEVISILKKAGAKLFQLGLNRNGSPKHPLYLPADAKPVPYLP
jgi:hypothetical protein